MSLSTLQIYYYPGHWIQYLPAHTHTHTHTVCTISTPWGAFKPGVTWCSKTVWPTMRVASYQVPIWYLLSNLRLYHWQYKNTVGHILSDYSPRIARTTSSLRISMEPLEIKYSALNTSPRWMRVSPGGAWVVLNFIERALRQPGLAPLKAGLLLRRLRLRWRQMSAWRHSGKLFKTLIEKRRKKRGFSQIEIRIIRRDLHLRRLRLRWRQMSAWRHSGKLFKTLIEKRKKRGFSQIEIGTELQRESPEAARTGPLEGWTVVEEIAVEVRQMSAWRHSGKLFKTLIEKKKKKKEVSVKLRSG